MAILLNPEDKAIHAAVGKAIDSYAMVEGSQVFILEAILGIPRAMASTIFFAVQNTRSRHEMMQSILSLKYGDKYKKFWTKCGTFLQVLSKFRNAVVHWQPIVAIYVNKNGSISTHDYELIHGSAGQSFPTLKPGDFPNFLKDCQYIRQELLIFNEYLRNETPYATLRDKFLQPNLRPNLTVLRPHPKPKEPKRQPQSSQKTGLHKGPGPSAKQRRMRALKTSAKKKTTQEPPT